MHRHKQFWKWYTTKDLPPGEVQTKGVFCLDCRKVIQYKQGWLEPWKG